MSSFLRRVLHKIKNWRMLPVREARDPFSRNLDIFDIPFIPLGVWHTVAAAVISGDSVPAAVILLGEIHTISQWADGVGWAEGFIRQHPALRKKTKAQATTKRNSPNDGAV